MSRPGTNYLRFTQFILLALVLALSLPAAGSAFAAPAEGTSAGANTPVAELDILVLVDQSHSQLFTDPFKDETVNGRTTQITNRSLAMDSLLNILAVDTLDVKYRIGIILFGTRPELIQPFTEVRDHNALESVRTNFMRRHTGDLKDMGWTDLDAALSLAYDTFANGHDRRAKPAIIVLTDGKPETPQANPRESPAAHDEYLKQIKQTYLRMKDHAYEGALCNPMPGGPVPMHIVPMIPEAVWQPKFVEAYGSYWADLVAPGGTVPSPVVQDLRSLQKTFVDIFLELICQPIGASQSFRVPSVNQFEVSDLYAQITFKVIKSNPDITVEVYRPNADGSATNLNDPAQKQANLVVDDGKFVRKASSYLDETWGVGRHQPWQGKWTVALYGEGSVSFFYVRSSDVFRLDLLRPNSSYHPLCKPMVIEAQVVNTSNQPIDQEVRSFDISVAPPKGASASVPVTAAGPVRRAIFTDTGVEGRYDISLSASIEYQGGEAVLPFARSIQSELWPWLAPALPSANAHYTDIDKVPLRATVNVGCEPTVAAAFTHVTVTIRQGEQVVYDAGELSPATQVGEGIFAGEVPAHKLAPSTDAYVAHFTLDAGVNGVPPDEVDVPFFVVKGTSAAVAPPTAEPTVAPTATAAPTPTPAPTVVVAAALPQEPKPSLPLGLIAGGLGVLAVLAGGLWWLRVTPTLGNIALLGPGEPIHVTSGLGGRMATNVTLGEPGGQNARFKVRPTGSRLHSDVEFTVAQLSEGLEGVAVGNSRNLLNVGQAFTPTNDESIWVGSNRYTFSSDAVNLDDDYTRAAARAPVPDTQPIPARKINTEPIRGETPRTEPVRNKKIDTEPIKFGDEYDTLP